MEVRPRSSWAKREPKHVTDRNLTGPSILHWNGSGMKWQHVREEAREAWIVNRLRAVQGYHMDTRGWSDIAYSFAADPWGIAIWELRGLDVRTGANGTKKWNDYSHALYVMTGLGDGPPTQDAMTMIDESVEMIAEAGTAEAKFLGHRDVRDTSCPGDYLYNSLPNLNVSAFEMSDPVFEDEPQVKMTAPVAMFSLGSGYAAVDAQGRIATAGPSSLGDLRTLNLQAPIVDAEGTSTGKGYYMVGADGGVFTFGDAVFHGSVPQVLDGRKLQAPIVSIEVEDTGYWMVGADGGVFTFGSLPWRGSFVDEVT